MYRLAARRCCVASLHPRVPRPSLSRLLPATIALTPARGLCSAPSPPDAGAPAVAVSSPAADDKAPSAADDSSGATKKPANPPPPPPPPTANARKPPPSTPSPGGFVYQPRVSNPGAGTFVSAHYNDVGREQVAAYLTRKRMHFTEAGDHLRVKECPFCHPINDDPSNMYKLNLLAESGAHHCFRCGAKGSWFDFKKRLGDLKIEVSPIIGGRAPHAALPSPAAQKTTAAELASHLVQLAAMDDVMLWLTGTEAGQRGIEPRVLEVYGVGGTTASFPAPGGKWADHRCASFPLTAPAADGGGGTHTVRAKLRSITEKPAMRMHPKGASGWGFFGWATVPAEADELVITEGELDAMAVYQATGVPTVSLPNGASSLPVELIPMLERFTKIWLWMDDDVPGQEAAEKFSKKLGLNRCFSVRPSHQCPQLLRGLSEAGEPVLHTCKDANEGLLAGLDLTTMLERATLMPHEQITTFSDLRASVYDQFMNPNQYSGQPCRSIPTLTKILRGHRRGELTVLTGSTGVGKTTLLAQLSLDYCAQNVNTLWGSFEIKNERLAKMMLQQLAEEDLARDLTQAKFDRWADKFSELPMYFLKFFGSTDLDTVLDAMEYACYVCDVQHVILDNLQFMMSGQGRNFDKFEMQDRAISEFRRFATQHNIHITLVIHPRKEDNPNQLNISSIFGSAKSTQEADTVLIIKNTTTDPQENSFERVLEVRKNRFSGQLGAIELEFDPSRNLFHEPHEPLASFFSHPASLGAADGRTPPAKPIQTAKAAGAPKAAKKANKKTPKPSTTSTATATATATTSTTTTTTTTVKVKATDTATATTESKSTDTAENTKTTRATAIATDTKSKATNAKELAAHDIIIG